MAYTITPNPVAQATVNSNFRKDSYSLDETQKKQYAKAVKYAKKKKTFWSDRIPLNVPLNIPTLSDNRSTDISKVVTNLKDGYESALFQLPLVVAIPGKAVEAACAKDPNFIEYWDIRPEGFWNQCPESDTDEFFFYLQVCDGRHRQVIYAASEEHPEFSDFSELNGMWECQVVFATSVETYEDTVQAFELSHGLYLDVNSKKIRKPTAENNLGAEIKKGDPEATKNIARLIKTGFWVEGGKNGYGDLSGIKTRYALFRRDALKNPMINDSLLCQAAKWIKLDTGFKTNTVYSPTLAAALALVQVVVPKLTAGNGMQSLFEDWFKNKISDNDNPDLVSHWKELGGNQDNKYAESVALGMMTDFKGTRLKKAKKQGEQYKSAYDDIVLEAIEEKLFPKMTHSIATDQDVELEAETAEENK
jgi:hypothetical protein